MSQILIVEDEAHIAEGLRFNLEAEGHAVTVVETGEDALQQLQEKNTFDAVVLDVMLPGMDGFNVVRDLREAQNYVPVLLLTALGRPEDVLFGFEAGADDYLPKPFNLDILIARIESLLRRKQWLKDTSPTTSSTAPTAAGNSFRFGDKLVDFEQLRLHAGDKVFQLTLMEADLLRFLIENSGRPVSRKTILEKVWNLHEDTDTRAIDNFIVRLRRYIEADPANPKHLLTVRGVGYEFVAVPEK
jgi:two-component system alkaline phosphatase synthesis response regulator PhoP